jgi:pimeloyl-ACP methyl ester carboxylesterase
LAWFFPSFEKGSWPHLEPAAQASLAIQASGFDSMNEPEIPKEMKPKRSWPRRLLRLVVFAACIYVGVILLLAIFENWLVYFPTSAQNDWTPPPSPEIKDIELISADGTGIHAWWWPAADSKGAILYCHGNAGNLSSRGQALVNLRKILGESILIFDYPGYGKSEGRPSEKGCCQAADAAYDWLIEHKIDPEKIVIYGGSLGGGVAVDLASRKKHRALVLAKTFTSLPDVAQRLHPWLPVRWFMRNRFDNLGKIGRCTSPVFIVHGTADSLVPFEQSQRLFAAANEPKQFMPIDGGDHNDPLPGEFIQKLQAFLRDSAHK